MLCVCPAFVHTFSTKKAQKPNISTPMLQDPFYAEILIVVGTVSNNVLKRSDKRIPVLISWSTCWKNIFLT